MNLGSNSFTITGVVVRNIKRIKHVRIKPGADVHVILIGGWNRAGKTSFMDSITMAFFGGDSIPDDVIRHGEEQAEVVINLNDGAYVIRRTITAVAGGKGKAKTTLVITGPDGRIASPQAWLDAIVAGRFLDPIGFIARPAKEQRAILLRLAGIDVTAIDEERQNLFNERTAVSRLLRQSEGLRAKISPMDNAPVETRRISEIQADQEALSMERRAADEARAAHNSLIGRLAALDQVIDGNHAEIAKLEAALAAARATLATNQERRVKGVAAIAEAAIKVPSQDQFDAFDTRAATLRSEATASETYNRWQATAAANNRQVTNADREIELHRGEVQRLTERLAAIDAHKLKLLAEAEMPIDGLEVDDDGIKLNGALFANASQAEQLACALAIARRQAPRLTDVWVRDGSRFDEEAGLETLAKIAESMGIRVWVERPGRRDPEAIIIQDGEVLGAEVES